jgi:hypothetical protein
VSNTRRRVTLDKGPSAAVYSWRPLSLPSARRWHLAKMVRCRASGRTTLDKAYFVECLTGTLGKVYFHFFQPNFLWFVHTLCRLTCSIFSTIIKQFAIAIRFCSFNCISSDNSYLNGKSLEKWKIVNAKMFMLLSTSYGRFQVQTGIFEHHAHKTWPWTCHPGV